MCVCIHVHTHYIHYSESKYPHILYLHHIISTSCHSAAGDWESRHVERSGSITPHSTGPNNKGGLKQYSRRYGFYGRMVVVVVVVAVVVAVVVVVGYPRMVGILVGLLTTGKTRSLKCLKTLACYILCVACLKKSFRKLLSSLST